MILKLGDKEFTLPKQLPFNQWVLAEDMGLERQKLSNPKTLKNRDIRTLVYVVVNSVDTEITPEWVGEQLNMDNLNEVMETIGDFLGNKEQPAEEIISEPTTDSEEPTGGHQT